MPIADLEKRRAYDRERARKRYQKKIVSCIICGAQIPDGRRKLCRSPACRRTYKTQKQREYDSALTPAQRDEKRAAQRDRDARRNATRHGRRNSWEWNLKHVHGLTAAQWHAMFMEQSGCCYLCERPLPDDRKKVAVDHDHSHCGKSRSCGTCRRGLACSNCNTLIGLANEDPQRLRLIAGNLERQAEITQALIAAGPQQCVLL